jgi:uncharacterized GH25 family protein
VTAHIRISFLWVTITLAALCAITADVQIAKSAETNTSLTVAVIDSLNGEQLAGTRVQLVTEGARPHVKKSWVTGRNGNLKLQFENPLVNELKFWTVADGYVPEETKVMPDLSGKLPETCTIRLTRAVTVGGIVLDASGKPLSGVEVHVYSIEQATGNTSSNSQTHGDFHYERTDAKGRWSCSHIAKQIHNVRFRFIHPEYVTAEIVPDATKDAGIMDGTVSADDLIALKATMLMKPGFVLNGVVIDSNQKPIEGAEIDGPDFPVWTPADGHFSLHNCPTGMVVLIAYAKGFAPQRKKFFVGEAGNEARFQLDRGNTLRLAVKDSKGRGIPNAKVIVEHWQSQPADQWQWETDAHGRLTWDSAPDDELLYTISHVGYETLRGQSLKADGQEHVLVLHKQLQISGKVFDADNSTPLAEFVVIPGQLHADHYDWNSDGIVNGKSGNYLIRLPKQINPHVLQAQAKGYYPEISRTFKDDEEEGVADFRLKRGEPLSGRVQLPDGKPASKAQVALCTTDNQVVIGENGSLDTDVGCKSETDGHGEFVFQPRRSIKWIAAANEQGYAEMSIDDFKQSPAIRLQSWGRISGVLRSGAVPCSNQLVKLTRIGSLCPQFHPERFTRLTDSEGRFTFDHVPAGQLMIGRILQTQFSHGQVIEIAPGQTTEISLGNIGRTVTGRIESADGRQLDWEGANHPAYLRISLPPLSVPKLADAVATNRWTREHWDSSEGRARQLRNVSYVFEFRSNNVFQTEDVPPGTYECEIHYHQAAAIAGQSDVCLGILKKEVTIPVLPAGEDDTPVDLGTLIINLR